MTCCACDEPLPALPSDDVVHRPAFHADGSLDYIELAHRVCYPEWGVFDGWPVPMTDAEALALQQVIPVRQMEQQNPVLVDANTAEPPRDIHVTPVGDLRAHDDTRTCWCGPRIETVDELTGTPFAGGAAVVVHHSADGRELIEQYGLQ